MKNYRNVFKLIGFAFSALFILNMLVMYMFFDTNVFNPVTGNDTKTAISGNTQAAGDTPDKAEMTGEASDENVLPAPDEYFWDENGDNMEKPLESSYNAVVSDDGGVNSSYFMTTQEMGFLENLSILDKLEALSLISKVGKDEADSIYDMASDGVTFSEMEEIKAILARYLDQKEMAALAAILDKNKKDYLVSGD